MHLKMGDFIMGMGKEFATEAMDISEKLSLNEGNILFKVGDAAGHFYVLLKGQVQLSLGKTGPVVYQARHSGGNYWLVMPDWPGKRIPLQLNARNPRIYSDLIGKGFLKILKKNPANEALLFKRLAEMLGNRLLELIRR